MHKILVIESTSHYCGELLNINNFVKSKIIVSINFKLPFNCFNDISVNASPISVRLKPRRQRINTVTFYLRDISTPLVGVVFKHINRTQEPLIYKC